MIKLHKLSLLKRQNAQKRERERELSRRKKDPTNGNKIAER